LFDRVRKEYNRHFTDRGVERRELQEARKLQEDTQAEVYKFEQQLRDLDQDIERAAALHRELAQLNQQEEELSNTVAAYTSSLEEIGALENALTAARLKLESAQNSEQAARRDMEGRQALVDAVSKATKTHAELQESSTDSLSALNLGEGELRKAQTLFNEANRRRKAADALAALRRSDFDYYNNKLHLEQLKERKERIDQARNNAAQAQGVLARNRMDSRALKAIQEAERGVLTANAQLQTGAPNILLRGRAECRLQIDDADTVLGKDEVRRLSVADRTRLTIPGTLDIEITAGSSTEGFSRRVEEAQRSLEAACERAGVASPDEAGKAFEERREASRHVEAKVEIEKNDLRDLTYEQLEEKLLGLEQGVPDYISKRAKEHTICPDLGSAKKEWANADANQKKVSEEWDGARESLEGARNVRDNLNEKHQETRIQLDLLVKDLNRAHENLDRARMAVPDETLETNLTEAVRAVSVEEGSVRTAETSLKVKNPERIKALSETAKGSLQTTRSRRNAAQTEQTEVKTRLRIRGEDGLHEKLHESKTRLERVETDNRASSRRAAAAKLLFETMREEREKARRAYVAPLKERIEYLGRLVFDESFQVEIDDDLLIASRTANGVTVPFHLLSGGTKEQLSLIFRLACSMIVAKDGGMPVVLDDALGYTDPDRLRLMGAVLARAAKECQIVIFTCVPDRYGNVGEATVVSLR